MMPVTQKLMILWFLLLNIVLVNSCVAQSVSSPKLTQAQVNQTVAKFLQQIGQPMKGTAFVSLAAPSSLSNPNSIVALQGLPAMTTPIQLRWQVTIPDAIYPKFFEVSDSTGQIVHYIRDDNSNDHQPLGTPISKTQAIAHATSVLTNTGAFKTNELAFKEAILMQGSVNSQEWFVSWKRVFGKVDYREQGANVSVDAQTGEITGCSSNFHTPPPASAGFNISQDQAIAVAAQAFAAAGRQFADPPTVKAEVVQLNGYWQPSVGEAVRQPIARVAWVCHFVNGRQSYEAWVDAETGQVIGGQYVGPRGRVRPNSPKQSAKH